MNVAFQNSPANRRLTILSVLFCAFLCVTVGVGPAGACANSGDHDAGLWIESSSSTDAWFVVRGFSTFEANVGQVCVCGFRDVPSLARVTSVILVDRSTGQPVNGFSFFPNSTTSTSIAEDEGGSWYGFSATVSSPIPGGTDVELVFTTELVDGATFDDVKDDLLDAGGSVVGAGEGTMEGRVGHATWRVKPTGP